MMYSSYSASHVSMSVTCLLKAALDEERADRHNQVINKFRSRNWAPKKDQGVKKCSEFFRKPIIIFHGTN
jgi:hypothetical protein